MRYHSYLIQSCVIAALLTGCCSTNLYEQTPACSLEDAGTTHIAVLSVAPWKKYRDLIQAQFNLTSDGALQQVLPTTADIEDKTLAALASRLKVGLASQSAAPPDLSKISFEGAPTSSTAPSLPGSTMTNTLGTNPMMRYWAASALYQEVQLLNRYLSDAAIQEDFYPYIVRLQVSFMPRTRNEPYDVYATISFFKGDFPRHIIYTNRPAAHVAHKENTPAADTNYPAARQLMDDLSATRKHDWVGNASTKDLRIIPLLVTDDIETAMESRSAERMSQLAFALQAAYQGVGAAADIQRIHDRLQSILAHDYNSQFTVARSSENTLRVRFGAAQQAAAHYAAIPQTHNVTVLLLAPKPAGGNDDWEKPDRLVHVVSRMSLVNVTTGKELGAEPNFLINKARDAMKARGIAGKLDDEQVSLVLRCIYANDYAAFDQLIGGPGNGLRGIHFRDSLWTDLVTFYGRSAYQTTSFEVPALRLPEILVPQTPVLIDDKKSAMTATIAGMTGVTPNEIAAAVKVKLLATGSITPQDFMIPATSVSGNEAGNQLVATFASIAATGQKIDGAPSVVLYGLSDPFSKPKRAARFIAELPCLYTLKVPGQPAFELSTTASTIVADKQGRGKVRVGLDIPKPTKGITLSLKGADFANVSCMPTNILSSNPACSNKMVITASGVITLELFNLSVNEKVTLGAADEDAKTAAPDIVLPVVQPAAISKKSDGK